MNQWSCVSDEDWGFFSMYDVGSASTAPRFAPMAKKGDRLPLALANRGMNVWWYLQKFER